MYIRIILIKTWISNNSSKRNKLNSLNREWKWGIILEVKDCRMSIITRHHKNLYLMFHYCLRMYAILVPLSSLLGFGNSLILLHNRSVKFPSLFRLVLLNFMRSTSKRENSLSRFRLRFPLVGQSRGFLLTLTPRIVMDQKMNKKFKSKSTICVSLWNKLRMWLCMFVIYFSKAIAVLWTGKIWMLN